ncbi:hypothetical protein HMPREF7215_1469 [Pyramidobacter piscolens W5455]|uniref:Uncharacterized protein n=1 Tax=Pyramidobacter piscolens W5455 TaxID=352165 RepID=A0ABM9ZX50_9BACT|nr:hypothetical protein HMPREF7215_1469 [Pyramidobacter piscolens W5455]
MAPSAVFLPCSGAVGEVFNKQYLIIQKRPTHKNRDFIFE